MTTLTAARGGSRASSGERIFHVAMTLAILAVVFVGFARSFYLAPLFPGWPAPTEAFFTLHGIIFTAWFVLLPAQALLIANRRVDLHRVFGAAGVAIAVAMVVAGIYGALLAAARPTGFVGIPIPGWQFLIIPFLGMVQFAVFFGLAIAKRRDGQAHKRWMLVASIAIVPAAFARWPLLSDVPNPLAFFAATDLLFVPMIVRDLMTRGKLHEATLWGVVITVALQPISLALSGTSGWEALAKAMIRLVA
jgi:uncharacterized membrane protein YozB (DUF420 family)